MAKFTINKTKDYTVMSNYHLKEKEMSLKAKGLLSLMLSLPNDWDYSIEGLIAICKENESAINSTLKELKDFGYLVVTKLFPHQTISGRIEYQYDIYEKPTFRKQEVEKQDLENLGVENLGVENSSNNNSININNKELNNKENKIKENIKEIIDYLNEKTKKHFRTNNANTVKFINARLNDGFTVDDFKKVIDNKTSQWLNTSMDQYLRPQTLFAPTNFESYLNEKTNGKTLQPKVEHAYKLNQQNYDYDIDDQDLGF